MPNYMERENIKSVKTERALNVAMFSLLANRNFGKITVSDICEEALISRATFYTHFIDKYDWLKYWLTYLRPDSLHKDDPYDLIEKKINEFIIKNASVIQNLVYGANDETLRILLDFILHLFRFEGAKNEREITTPKYEVLSNFFSGGLLFYSQWLVQNKFQSEVAPMNIYIYDIIKHFQDWNS